MATPSKHRGFRVGRGDATGEQLVLSLDENYRVLHVADSQDVETDWNVANPTHPTLYVHSATTPATDYIALDHDATDGTINVASGNLKLAIAGTDVLAVTATGINVTNAAGPALMDEAATTTNPTLIPNRAETDTGIGWASDTLHFVLGGANEVQVTTGALSPGTSDGNALGTTALMWSDLFLAAESVINFNNGNVTITHAAGTLAVAGADVGIGGAAVANQMVTVTDTAVSATGRVMKLAGTLAAAALTDGYGAFEVDVTLSGSPTDHSAASSSWVNITGGTVPAGTYICARNDGVYEEAAATVTNAKVVFGSRMQYIFSDTDALRFPFSVNTGNAAITALIDTSNHSDLGLTAGTHSSAVTGSVPFCRDAAGTIKYIRVYDTAA